MHYTQTRSIRMEPLLDQKDITVFIEDVFESFFIALKRLIKAKSRGYGLISIDHS